MSKYILRRLAISIPVLIGITVLIFIFINAAPGDPVSSMIDPTLGDFSAERMAQARAQLGLDRPLPLRYVLWLKEIVRGNLGYSMITQKPVAYMIGHRLWATIRLTLVALAVSVVIGISIGILSAIKQYSWIDYLSTFLSFAAVSVPGFFLSLGLIYLLALKLRWLPTSGMFTLGQPHSLWDYIRHMIMPAMVLGVGSAAPLVRYARSSMLESMSQEYVNTARAKGQREVWVILKHAFPNALIPLITVIGLRLPGLFEGAVIVEQIFQWQGMGTLAIWAVTNRDYTLLMGLNLISGILVLSANLLADIAYAVVDPRVRYD
jgi:peptide/nickel transport system permease protein